MSKREIFAVLKTLINLVRGVAFDIPTKFRLKNRIATVYVLQCKTRLYPFEEEI